LRPISDGEEERYPVESYQVDLATDDTPDMADSLPTPPPWQLPRKRGFTKLLIGIIINKTNKVKKGRNE